MFLGKALYHIKREIASKVYLPIINPREVYYYSIMEISSMGVLDRGCGRDRELIDMLVVITILDILKQVKSMELEK